MGNFGVKGDESESEGEDEVHSSGEEGGQKPMSTHEKRLQRMNARIEELEARALADAEWHMRGEVNLIYS